MHEFILVFRKDTVLSAKQQSLINFETDTPLKASALAPRLQLYERTYYMPLVVGPIKVSGSVWTLPVPFDRVEIYRQLVKLVF